MKHPPKIINTYYDQNSFITHYNEAVENKEKELLVQKEEYQ